MEARLLSSTKQGAAFSRSLDGDATRYRQLCKIELLLGSLHRGPLYGYELYHMVQEYYDIKMTSFYTTLDHLVTERCVYYEIVPDLGTSRGRRIYTLTHKGYRQFSILLHDFLLTDKALPGEIDIALRFLDRLSEAEALSLLQARRCLLLNQRALTLTKSAHQAGAGTSNCTLSYRLCLLDAELAWIDQMIVTLQKASVSA